MIETGEYLLKSLKDQLMSSLRDALIDSAYTYGKLMVDSLWDSLWVPMSAVSLRDPLNDRIIREIYDRTR